MRPNIVNGDFPAVQILWMNPSIVRRLTHTMLQLCVTRTTIKYDRNAFGFLGNWASVHTVVDLGSQLYRGRYVPTLTTMSTRSNR